MRAPIVSFARTDRTATDGLDWSAPAFAGFPKVGEGPSDPLLIN